MIGRTNVKSGSGISKSGALIRILVPIGSTVIIKKNDIIVHECKETEKQCVIGDSKFDLYYYNVKEQQYDDYTIEARKNNSSKSQTITVDSSKVYNVTIEYSLDLILNGQVLASFNGTVPSSGSTYASISATNDTIKIAYVYNVDVTYFSTFSIDIYSGWSYHGPHVPAIFIGTGTPSSDYYGNFSNVSAVTQLNSTTGGVTAKRYDLNIEQYTGLKTVGFSVGATPNENGYLRVSNLWLE